VSWAGEKIQALMDTARAPDGRTTMVRLADVSVAIRATIEECVRQCEACDGSNCHCLACKTRLRILALLEDP
jgi:hypothetical protein